VLAWWYSSPCQRNAGSRSLLSRRKSRVFGERIGEYAYGLDRLARSNEGTNAPEGKGCNPGQGLRLDQVA